MTRKPSFLHTKTHVSHICVMNTIWAPHYHAIRPYKQLKGNISHSWMLTINGYPPNWKSKEDLGGKTNLGVTQSTFDWYNKKNNIPISYTAYYIQHPTHTDYCIHQCPTTQNYYQLTKWNRIGCLTVMYDREQIGTIQIPHIDKRNDYALWLTILRKGYTAHGIQEPLAIYRSHNGVSKGNKLAFLKYHYQMFHHIVFLQMLP